MKKKIIVFDDESVKVLEKQINQSHYVREAVKYMSMDITPDTIDGLRKSYDQLVKKLIELESKIDYIAERIQ
mgnify:CR=1 FL=1